MKLQSRLVVLLLFVKYQEEGGVGCSVMMTTIMASPAAVAAVFCFFSGSNPNREHDLCSLSTIYAAWAQFMQRVRTIYANVHRIYVKVRICARYFSNVSETERKISKTEGKVSKTEGKVSKIEHKIFKSNTKYPRLNTKILVCSNTGMKGVAVGICVGITVQRPTVLNGGKKIPMVVWYLLCWKF